MGFTLFGDNKPPEREWPAEIDNYENIKINELPVADYIGLRRDQRQLQKIWESLEANTASQLEFLRLFGPLWGWDLAEHIKAWSGRVEQYIRSIRSRLPQESDDPMKALCRESDWRIFIDELTQLNAATQHALALCHQGLATELKDGMSQVDEEFVNGIWRTKWRGGPEVSE